ncbi:hypothetical protein CONPUDRAFT_168872 [Coniophora puteana RWD-64-598 SS2]|uniref:F-box domain-containing protein n=1 Tax=Coniophora puteana (strain RWD-64-598) TaxID=741705 RepID=A0A5M3MBB6_CONPW|nr:uncharacterized protein CONPUDRAFT_168872 [Coniophora puteana RWD-64-598 SS2]EIW76306.1 hypothetical protein CONPUDRAFT_168872 [Coniophora puteana RWD-64-598 SS2]
MMTRDQALPPIMLLPAEILLMIFYWASRRRVKHSRFALMTTRENEEARNSWYTAATSQQLAFVCGRWRDVLAMREVYWKSLNITIDGETFISSIIKTFFAASRDNTIRVTVAPRDLTSRSLTPDEEQERLVLIMKHMAPHLGRLFRLNIHTFYRSTVVNISRFFNAAVMSKLSELRLVSQDTDDTAHLNCSALQFPRIRSLHTDARSFVDLMKAGVATSELLTSSDDYDFFNFSITKFRPKEASSAPTATELFEALRLVDAQRHLNLEIHDIALACEDYVPQRPLLANLYSLEVYDLEGPAFSAICNSLDSHDVDGASVVRCEAERCGFIFCGELHVAGVRSSCSLLRMVQDWEGIKLIIEDCEGFDDWFLGSLAFCSERHSQRFACPELACLEITGCTFSASALQRMCEMRLQFWRTGGADEDEFDHLTSVGVSDGPKLDEGLRHWFEENLETFTWEEKQM